MTAYIRLLKNSFFQLLFAVTIVALMIGCELIEDPEADTAETPLRVLEADTLAATVIDQLGTDLLEAGFTESEVSAIQKGAEQQITDSDLIESDQIGEVAPAILEGTVSPVKTLDTDDEKIEAIDVIVSCLTRSLNNEVSAGSMLQRVRSFAAQALGEAFDTELASTVSSNTYSAILKSFARISIRNLKEMGISDAKLKNSVKTIVKSIFKNLENAGITDIDDIAEISKEVASEAISSLDEAGIPVLADAVNAVTSGVMVGLEENGSSSADIASVSDDVAQGTVSGLKQAGISDSEVDAFITEIKTGINEALDEAGVSSEDKDNVQSDIDEGATDGKSGFVGNERPVADDQGLTVSEDNNLSITLTAADPEGKPLTFSIAESPAHGTLSGTVPDLTYSPDLNFNGSDSFTFKANDATFDSKPATIAITIAPVNDPPMIQGTPATSVNSGSSYSFTPTGSNVDVGDNLSYSIVNQPSWATFDSAAGTLSGTPDNEDAGTNSTIYSDIQITVSDDAASIGLPGFDITVFDTIPPSEASSFTAIAGDGSVSLSWSNPVDSDFAGITLRKSTVSYPSTPTDGTQIYSGNGTGFEDSNAIDDTRYYYTVFAYDEVPNYSTGSNASATLSEIADTTAPTNPFISINSGVDTTSSIEVTLTLSADDGNGVTAYHASEGSIAPHAGDSGWTSVSSSTGYSDDVSFALSSGDGTKTVYVWFKDAAGNVSTGIGDSITLSVPDTEAPTNPSVTIDNDAASTYTTAVVLNLSADDGDGVTAYHASEGSIAPHAGDSGWISVSSSTSYSDDVSFTLSGGDGTKTVYVWFKDAAGNVSSSDNDSIELSTSKLSDTGQSTSFTDTFGEDSDYSFNLPSYTDKGDGTITDNRTYLLWQQQDNNTKFTLSAASVYCAELGLGGKINWRLPSIHELATILDLGSYDPAINNVFTGTNSSDYWSSTSYTAGDGLSWLIDFSDGSVGNSHLTSESFYVRCVCGVNQSNSIIDNGNGVVFDETTGLTWQQEEGGSMDWESALNYCNEFSLNGYNDWRLPNYKELQSIVYYTRSSPSIDTTLFPDTYSTYYWSSTSRMNRPLDAWRVHFDEGFVLADGKSGSLYVRCVRGGQSDLPDTVAPVNPSITINNDDATTNSITPILNLSA
ncbi:MAG: DUF1566 domain-containing protein, partial [Proteobacteria bacterium]|nr:DUF1566 domain-containing protein [Pseudomonadota bacterium]